MTTTGYIFNHIPKTGGTSLLLMCRESLELDQISPHLIDLDIRFRTPAPFEKYALIAGHFSLLAQMGFSRDRYSITMLRQPIRRIFSTYAFYRIATEGGFLRDKARELPFDDFVHYFKDSPTVIHNPYCHHFAAMEAASPGYPDDPTALLAAAKQNLAAFDFVGISEQFAASARLLCRELGWKLPAAMPHENRSASESQFGDIRQETMSLLMERNRLDCELYEFARQLFHSREQTPTVETRVPRQEGINRFICLSPSRPPAGQATLDAICAHWVRHEAPEHLQIQVDFTTTIPPAEFCLGIAITDSSGSVVWGTNSADNHLDLAFEPGQGARAIFLLECQLPEGPYSITIALSDRRRLGFHECWIDRAERFTVPPLHHGDSGRLHFVRLLHYGSFTRPASDLSLAEDGPEAMLEAVFAESPVLHPKVSSADFSPRHHSAPRSRLHSPNRYPTHVILGAHDKLSSPRVRLQLADTLAQVHSENRLRLRVTITNLGDQVLSSRYIFPVHLSYHWLAADGTVELHDGLRSKLHSDILPGDSSAHELIVAHPPNPACTTLCITLVQEDVFWFDECNADNRLLVRFRGLTAVAA